ncbi:IS110 family transposase [Micromonospora sp. PPF5-17]|uniref:IS110 family transposase n=1 Tax=Micromonospora solifontis TaxID=2487138 RepID=A0ABX9WDL2_9ACTN|nr:IS110 family transposase [Micromonospora sp. PPF5-17B]NES37879.1 IS110 family transposase [Micromonospora solifontis]NES54248.1 IS110 family transposase [Micromonospora sp. PPF5-6]RNL97891.1 IS110 family transposase [Micromonospora solifontis]
MDVVVERAAGLDIAKGSLVACVRVPRDGGGYRVHKRKFSTLTAGLLELAGWLAEHEVTRVGMESTSDYWKPVFYLLEDQFECWLLNARHMRAVPGRKTDMADAEWIADLVAHGLVRPSFVPPVPIRRLRDLTRRRALLTAERTREKQRMEKLLEDAGVKLSIVATDIFGVSARTMIEALIAGERDGQVLAELAKGRMRAKRRDLAQALLGRFNEHHAFLAEMILANVDHLDTMIAQLDARISQQVAPYQAQIDLLDTVPGIDQAGAQAILAEIGPDMSQFPTPGHLASWAGACPGNNKTGGVSRPGKARPGNRWLRAALGIAALGAVRTRNSYAGALFRRIAARRGGKRAHKAVAHSLLTAIWHILAGGVEHHDLGADYHLNRHNPDQLRRRAIAQLERLGYHVDLTPTAA